MDAVSKSKSKHPLVELAAGEEYSKYLKRFLMRRLNNIEDVEDLIQDIMVRLLLIDLDKSISKPLAYIYGVGSHVLANYREEKDKWKDIITHVTDEDESITIDIFDDQSIKNLDNQMTLEKLFSKLPSKQHVNVMVCHKLFGFSYVECAEKLGLSIHTIEKYITQSLFSLRKQCMALEADILDVPVNNKVKSYEDTIKRLRSELQEYVSSERVMVAAGLVTEEKLKQVHELVRNP